MSYQQSTGSTTCRPSAVVAPHAIADCWQSFEICTGPLYQLLRRCLLSVEDISHARKCQTVYTTDPCRRDSADGPIILHVFAGTSSNSKDCCSIQTVILRDQNSKASHRALNTWHPTIQVLLVQLQGPCHVSASSQATCKGLQPGAPCRFRGTKLVVLTTSACLPQMRWRFVRGAHGSRRSV